MINLEESFKKYQDKIDAIEKDVEHLKSNVYLESKIEAHLELLCVLGLMDLTERVSKKR